MDMKGKIVRINPTVVVSDKFQKREFDILTDDKYPQTVRFQLAQDKVSLIDAIPVGSDVTVDFNVRGREWSDPKDGTVKVFNTLDAWKIVAKAGDVLPKSDATSTKDGDDDLPF